MISNITEHAHFIVYADDTSMFLQSNIVNYLENLANDASSKLLKGSKLNYLEINEKNKIYSSYATAKMY